MQFFYNYAYEIWSVLWIIAITRSVLFWLNFIQIKQYRADRILWEIKRPAFHRLVFSKYRMILIVLFLGWEAVLRLNVIDPAPVFDELFAVIILLFLLNAGLALTQLIKKSLQLPKFTQKIWIFLFLSISLELLIAIRYRFWPEQMLLVEILQPAIIILIFYILYSPNLILHKRLKDKAREKRMFNKDLIVIGITGSFGKTTVKEYLAHILSKKFRVFKTPEHVNVDTGIAKLILKELKPSHDVFIVEMGAYKKGEIKSICSIVQPTHAIITGLSDQHLELFGSKENIAQAKFELVSAIDDVNNIVANRMDYLAKQFRLRHLEPAWYGQALPSNVPPEIEAKNIKFTAEGMQFNVDEVEFFCPNIGLDHLDNLLAAITMSKKLGMTLEEIAEQTKTLPVIKRTMEVKKGINGSVFIDDSYNANTLGVITALKSMRMLGKEKNIIIFKEVPELGDHAVKDHQQIARVIALSSTHAVFINSRYKKIMEEVLKEENYKASHIIKPENISEIKKLLDDGSAALFEGRGSETILEQL